MTRARDLEDRFDAALKPTSRWVVEGTWSGYSSAQSRLVHRMVVTSKEALEIRAIGYIRYTDGTGLLLLVRPCRPRERVEKIDGYSSLIRDCVRAGHGDVARLPR